MKQWGDWFTPLKSSEHVLCTRPCEESHTEASSQSLNADDLPRERRQTVTQHMTESFRQLVLYISSSRGSSQPREWIHVSLIGRGILYHWTTWEASTIQQERFLYILSSLPICVYTHIWVHTLAHLSQTGCLKHLFIKLGSSQSRHHQIWYLVSLCFLVHRRISSSHILTSQKCQGRSLQSLL